MSLRTHSDTQIREKINFIFVIFVGLFWTPGNNLCYVYHTLFQISSKLLWEFALSHLRKSKNLSWIALVFKLAPRFISRGYFGQSLNTPFVLRWIMLDEIFVGKTVKRKKLYVITPKVYLISPWIMNAMQIFVFFFKIAPTPPTSYKLAKQQAITWQSNKL